MDALGEELEQRLRRNPSDAHAFSALRQHYQQTGNFVRLAQLLQGWAQRVKEPQIAAHTFFEASEIVWQALADRPRTISLLEHAVAASPLHPEAAVRLEAIYRDGSEFRQLVEFYERYATALESVGASPRQIAAIHFRAAEVWEKTYKRPDRAILSYRKAFEFDPQMVPAIYAAREIYRGAGNLKAAAQLCEQEAQAERDPERKVALYRELAHMKSESLNDAEGAIAALSKALQLAPANVAVLQDLARVHLVRADRSRDPKVVQKERAAGAQVLTQLASRLAPHDAIPVLEQALDADPGSEEALGLLERWADRVNRTDLLAGRWVKYLEVRPDGASSDHRRRLLAAAYLSAGQPDYAVRCYEWLVQRGDAEAALSLVDLLRSLGRESDVLAPLVVAARGLNPDRRLPKLREVVSILSSRGDVDSAAEFAREVLELDAGDVDATRTLADYYRNHRAFRELRDLMLGSSRIPGLTPNVRRERLAEAARVSESQLGDLESAFDSWRMILAVEPQDREARSELDRLFESHGRWPDLVELLEKEAYSPGTASQRRLEIFGRLALIHRDRLHDLAEAVVAFRHVLELAPNDRKSRDAMCDALLELRELRDAVPLLRARSKDDDASPETRLEWSRVLARVYDEIEEWDLSFETWQSVLKHSRSDAEAIERLVVIDQQAQNYARLLETLQCRSELEIGEQRGATYSEMASIALGRLKDVDRGISLYRQALELRPSDQAVLDALCKAYEDAERFKELVVVLHERVKLEADLNARSELYRRIARTFSTHVKNPKAAAEAYEKVLDRGDELEALRYLRRYSAASNQATQFRDYSQRFLKVVEELDERRECALELAKHLFEQSDEPNEALALLERENINKATRHVPLVQLYTEFARQRNDFAKVAKGLGWELEILEDDGLRAPVAHQLADLAEHELKDVVAAIDALFAWHNADPVETEPLLRLSVLLERTSRWADLVRVLDTLADQTFSPEKAGEYVRQAARLAYDRLGDAEGAWGRLYNRVQEDDALAVKDLEELAKAMGRGEMLGELYSRLAESALTEDAQKGKWLEAARVQEDMLKRPAIALESALRALALNLSDDEVLARCERLAAAAKAWPRLNQVYETLIRRAPDSGARSRLLLRLANILDQQGGDKRAAFDKIVEALSLLPTDDELLARAEELATPAARNEELLTLYFERAQYVATAGEELEMWIKSARLADKTLRDRNRAASYLHRAVTAVRTADLFDQIENAVREMDALRKSAAEGPLEKLLAGIYLSVADDREDIPSEAHDLYRRAAQILEVNLHDYAAAFDVWVKAVRSKTDDATLDALFQVAERTRRLSALDEVLVRLADEAFDSASVQKILKRRALLLAERLGRHGEAADVYGQLRALDPQDPDVRNAWRVELKKAARHQELLLALDDELIRTRDKQARVHVLVDVAKIWDVDLKNRWEAIDAWKRVIDLDPGHSEAAQALTRLGASGAAEASDVLALGEDAYATDSHNAVEEDAPDLSQGPAIPAESTGEFLMGDDQDDLEEERTQFQAPLKAPFVGETAPFPDDVSDEDEPLDEIEELEEEFLDDPDSDEVEVDLDSEISRGDRRR